MNIETKERVETIAQLNDKLRTTFMGGKVMLTQSVACLNEFQKAQVLKAIRTFEAFNDDNNPHGERDFVSVKVNDETYFAKIDYYAPGMEDGSEDPADPKKTVRVMTVMHSSDY
jgi:Protein of unknown function (DUF3768)